MGRLLEHEMKEFLKDSDGSARMAYKARFRPIERLGPDGWSRFEPAAQSGLATMFELA